MPHSKNVATYEASVDGRDHECVDEGNVDGRDHDECVDRRSEIVTLFQT